MSSMLSLRICRKRFAAPMLLHRLKRKRKELPVTHIAHTERLPFDHPLCLRQEKSAVGARASSKLFLCLHNGCIRSQSTSNRHRGGKASSGQIAVAIAIEEEEQQQQQLPRIWAPVDERVFDIRSSINTDPRSEMLHSDARCPARAWCDTGYGMMEHLVARSQERGAARP